MTEPRFELAACQRTLLEEISDPSMKRRDVAQTYALALRSSEADSIDWAKVNGAIMARWSRSALVWIKERAWSGKCFDKPRCLGEVLGTPAPAPSEPLAWVVFADEDGEDDLKDHEGASVDCLVFAKEKDAQDCADDGRHDEQEPRRIVPLYLAAPAPSAPEPDVEMVEFIQRVASFAVYPLSSNARDLLGRLGIAPPAPAEAHGQSIEGLRESNYHLEERVMRLRRALEDAVEGMAGALDEFNVHKLRPLIDAARAALAGKPVTPDETRLRAALEFIKVRARCHPLNPDEDPRGAALHSIEREATAALAKPEGPGGEDGGTP